MQLALHALNLGVVIDPWYYIWTLRYPPGMPGVILAQMSVDPSSNKKKNMDAGRF